jgi:hypothetical protein
VCVGAKESSRPELPPEIRQSYAIFGRSATIILIILSTLGSALAFAQEPSKPTEQTNPADPARPDQSKPAETTPAEKTGASMVTQAENAAMKPVELFNLLERKSIVFPDIASSTRPLSPGQKFELFVDNSISVHTIVWSTLGSLIGQADDSPTGYGVGGIGYPKRLGSSLARETSGEFFGTFVIASALHEDPRFFPEYNPTLKHTLKHSLRRLFVARNDAGANVVNMPGLLGPLLGESLANVYWPDRNRTVGDTLFRYGLDLASRAAGNMFREYWPVVSAKMQHRPPTRGAPH